MKRPLVRFTPEAARLVSKFHPETRKLVRSAIEELRKNPFRGDDLREELTGFSSYKPGRYRILYKFDEDRNVIDVYYVGHRRDVYDQFRLFLKKIRVE
jgi:mRNA-degrading endonuclease RelE of RelBE toxin-antitoxin system